MGTKKYLMVRDVIKRPVFKKAVLLAGKRGGIRRVAWVHVLDLKSPAAFVNKDDLILTTGLGFHQSKKQRLSYLQELIQQEAAGLCIETGMYLNEIPVDMIMLANQHDFPLIELQESVRFVDITQDIHSIVINQQHLIMKNLESYSRKLQQLTLQTTDIRPILKLLHEYTGHQLIYYSEIEQHQFIPPLSLETGKELISFYKKAIQKENTIEGVMLTVGNKTVISQPIICLGQTLAHIGIVVHEMVDSEWLFLLLDYTARGIAHILLRTLFLEEQTNRHHNELIQDLLQNQIETEEQALQRLGVRYFNPAGSIFIGGVIEIVHNVLDEVEEMASNNQDILILLRSIVRRHGLYCLLMLKNNCLYILAIQERSNDESESKMKASLIKCVEGLNQSLGSMFTKRVKVFIGFGNTRRKLTQISDSFKEAFDTLSVFRTKNNLMIRPFYDEIGIFQIIKSVAEESILQQFVKRYIGRVIEYDKKNKTELLVTLDELLKSLGSKRETAKKLFIHRQTLYHRLEKLEELLGENFLDEANRICIEFSLRAYEMIVPNQTEQLMIKIEK